MKSRMLARASLIFLLTLGVIIDGPFARATDAISLTPSASSVAPGQTVDLTAAMPVVAAGSTTQTLTQVIDPTKVKLTSASDITFPAGWTLSYSTDGTSFSSTAPTTTAGWAAIRAVRATGDLVSSGSSNGFQVASRTATGTAQSIAPASITSSGTGDGFQAFFDPGHTRVFNIFHHKTAGDQITCNVISTGASCTGFPFNMGIYRTPDHSNGRVVGTQIWVPAYKPDASISTASAGDSVGFYCVNIAEVLSSGASPSMCSTPFVQMDQGAQVNTMTDSDIASVPTVLGNIEFYVIAGVGTQGSSIETKLWSLVTANGNLVCLDTATKAACTGMPVGGWPTGISKGGFYGFGLASGIQIWGDRLYIRGYTSDRKAQVACRLLSDPAMNCSGWDNLFQQSGNNANLVGQIFTLPNSSGQTRAVCLGPDGRQTATFSDPNTGALAMVESATAVSCWDENGSRSDGPASLSRLVTSSFKPALRFLNYSVQGTRIAWGNGEWVGGNNSIACWNTLLDGPCTTANLGTTTTANGSVVFSSSGYQGIFTGTGAKNYTAVIDPTAPNCLWVTQHDTPRMFLLNVVDGTSNCSAGAPTKASFSGSAIVPRMACNSNQDAIRQWESFTLKTAGTGTFTSATLTVKNSSGVAISGWTDRAVSLNTPLDLSTLSPGSTGLTPSFDVAFGGISGSITTASAEVKVVGDSPELCTRVTAAYVCPTGSGPIGSLSNAVATVSANGSSVLGGATTTLPQVDQSITVTAPALSTCTSSITGRAGDGGGGSSGTAISGVTVSLLDSSGNPVLVNGSPVTTTTASDGTYSFAGLLPNSYKVKFGNSQIAEVQSSTITSGGSGTTSRLPATSCTAGTSTLVENPAGDGLLNQVTGASVMNRSTPGNLVVNGDFTSSPVTSGGSTVAIQSGEVGMRAAGRDDHRLPGWSFSGGGPSTYARWQSSGASTPDGASVGNFYFGNSWWLTTPTFNATTAFSSGGVTQNSYVFRQDSAGNYGMTDANPVQISQTISTDIGRTYRLQFWQSSEPYGNNAGIAALELTGYSRTYFKVNRVTTDWTRYTFDFVATSNSTTLTFKSWGHISPASDELRLDDVILSRCGNADAEVNSGTTTISAGTNAVVNALYTIPATAAADTPAAGTQGSAQTINVLSNDSAASGATLTASTVRFCGLSPAQTPPSCSQTTLTTADGSYSVNTSTGVVTFTPIASFTGTATQPPTYQVTDSASNVISSTITPSVIARPALTADTSSGAWDQNQTISPLANDVAGNGASLVANSVKLCASGDTAPNCTATSRTITGQGTYTVNADGTITFDPLPGFTGTATPVTYSVTDSVGQKSSTTITPSVSAPNAPIAAADTTSGAKGAAQSVNLLANDAPGIANNAGLTLVASSAKLCDPTTQPAQVAPNCTATSVTVSGVGTYSISNGVVTFTPLASFSGSAQPLPYQVADSTGQVATASYIPTVIPPPTLVADTSSGAWNTPQLLNLISNSVGTSDLAGAGASLVASSVKLCSPSDTPPMCSIDSSSQTGLVVAGQGTYRISNTGVVSFTPLPTFSGTATPVTYSVTDSFGQKSSTTFTPTVANPNAPLAAADSTSGPQGAAQSVNVLANDAPGIANNADLSLVASSAKLCDPTTQPAQVAPNCTATSVTVSGVGTYSISNGVVTFTPLASFSGSAQPLPYQVADSTGQVATASYTPTVIPPPSLTPDTSSGAWDQNQTISPLANDVAGNGASLVANSVKLCASGESSPNCTATSLTITGQGTYTVNADGTITFDPLPSFTGTATPVTYSVTDSLGQKSSTTITPSVSAPNAPVANPQTKLVSPTGTTAFTTITGSNGLATGTQLSPSQTFLCDVAPNAQTPPNCTATTVTTPDGTWVLSQITGVATYQPNAGTAAGNKTAITYQVSDPAGQSASALLTPVIPPAPTANPDASSGQQGQAQVISLLGNDQPGIASNPLEVDSVKFCVGNEVAPNCSATSLTVSGQGTYAIDSLGIVTFTPIDSFTGAATPITYQVSDSIGQSVSSTLSIDVIPPPAPIANRDLGSAAYGQAVVFEPWKNDSGGDKPEGATEPEPQVLPASIRLCASGQSAPNCTATSITTPDGSYNLNTATGKVTFTPASGFSGTATAPVTYQISNNWTGASGPATTTAILIPTIAAPGDPLATNDKTSTKPDTPVILKPIINDSAGSFALDASTLRLCDATDIAPNCTHLTVTNAHGTYVVDPATGSVRFTPAKGFKGLATIPYVLSDMNSRFAHANLMITVSSSSSQPNEQEQESENQPGQDQLAKTGTNGAYALASLAIISAMAGTALVASSQRKQTRA